MIFRDTYNRAKKLANLYGIETEYFLSDDNQSFFYNNGKGNYSNSITGNFKNFVNFNASNRSDFEEIKSLIAELRKELNEIKSERKAFALIIKKLLTENES